MTTDRANGGRQFRVGERAEMSRVVTVEEIETFARITGDKNPVHLDDAFARRTRFAGRIAHGMLAGGLISAVLGTRLPGPGCIYLAQNLRFVRPIRPGDTITASVEVTEWLPEKRRLRIDTRCANQHGEDVVLGDASVLAEEPGAP